MRTVHAFSAGGIAFARDPLRLAVIRVPSARGDRWVLPKGLAEKGESLEAAAAREVREETGFEVDVAEPAGDVEYWFVQDGLRWHKRVRFFVMWITGGRAGDHDEEVLEVALVEPREALHRLAFASERGVVEKALAVAGATA